MNAGAPREAVAPEQPAVAASVLDGGRREGPGRPRHGVVIVVLACVIACQVLLSLFSIRVLSAVRAYVAGESLYSKAQKEAQLRLLDYLRSRSDEDYRRFTTALAVPLGDRAAREALEKPDEDLAAARA
ncbi:MAG TPA: hypothetical protein VIP05_33025, partial [Burkholderiaceae bacterium]